MANASLMRWIRDFRAAAKADKYARLRNHLAALELPKRPRLLLDGTIQVVIACAAYASIDGQSFETFLKMQRYDPSKAVGARYSITFDLIGKAFGRVLVGSEFGVLDLADLYDHPWNEFKTCGYWSIRISRIDGAKLRRRELTRLEKAVTDDLRCDYAENEVDFWFDEESIEGTLLVTVQDYQEV